jgi:hypothetical protein
MEPCNIEMLPTVVFLPTLGHKPLDNSTCTGRTNTQLIDLGEV